MVKKAAEPTDITYSLNPVRTGQMFLLSVELNDFTYNHWSQFTYVELTALDYDDMGGVIST